MKESFVESNFVTRSQERIHAGLRIVMHSLVEDFSDGTLGLFFLLMELVCVCLCLCLYLCVCVFLCLRLSCVRIIVFVEIFSPVYLFFDFLVH